MIWIQKKVFGSHYNQTINDMIDKDVRFSDIPDSLIIGGEELDELHDGEVEVHKYCDQLGDF